jgi:hypothetical protein
MMGGFRCGLGWRLSLLAIIAMVAEACADAPMACGDGVCSEIESVQSCTSDCVFDVVVVVETELYEPLKPHLAAYLEGLLTEGFKGYVLTFDPAPVSELKALLVEQYRRHDIGGAFLVGNLPAAWYEQMGLDPLPEEFPMDLYLQDLDPVFSDTDDNDVFDTHTPLGLEIYTSRVMGEVSQLQTYFDRVNRFRRDGHLVEPSAFVFIDDSWAREGATSVYELDDLYSTWELISDPSASTRENYVQQLTGDGAEFVFQMIHSGATYLSFAGVGGGVISSNQIRSYNFQASFVHLWNCSAARFTKDSNLGMIYTVENDRGLGAIGSTKTGAVQRPGIFHSRLALSEPVGEAFRYWFNTYGYVSDEWALGIVVLGDPMLIVWGDVMGMVERELSGAAGPESLEWMETILREQAPPTDLDTFEDYKLAHPEFFRD